MHGLEVAWPHVLHCLPQCLQPRTAEKGQGIIDVLCRSVAQMQRRWWDGEHDGVPPTKPPTRLPSTTPPMPRHSFGHNNYTITTTTIPLPHTASPRTLPSFLPLNQHQCYYHPPYLNATTQTTTIPALPTTPRIPLLSHCPLKHHQNHYQYHPSAPDKTNITTVPVTPIKPCILLPAPCPPQHYTYHYYPNCPL